MDREQMRMAILNQERIFRQQFMYRENALNNLSASRLCCEVTYYRYPQFLSSHRTLSACVPTDRIDQVHELHRLYHAQKQLMMQQAQTVPAPAVVDAEPRPRPQLDIWCGERATASPQQHIISFHEATAPAAAAAAALAKECNLELTLATGRASSSSSCCDAERRQGIIKRLKAAPSNSDSGATAVSSTSTDSELAPFREVVEDVATPVRFRGEPRRSLASNRAPDRTGHLTDSHRPRRAGRHTPGHVGSCDLGYAPGSTGSCDPHHDGLLAGNRAGTIDDRRNASNSGCRDASVVDLLWLLHLVRRQG
ncbi:hypothetical protein Zm00014a_038878 [Zea mays]|uniref:Uncharacterized protein n=1 Tax=Zea mays TaxID=4577 RepID=A0A3L6F9L4_MAIZE|nr:hypothetical protein Zm00014a_038878 [Zea mays]